MRKNLLLVIAFLQGAIVLAQDRVPRQDVSGFLPAERFMIPVSLAFSEDGHFLACASSRSSGGEAIAIWDFKKKESAALIERGPQTQSVAFLKDGSLLAGAVGAGTTVEIWKRDPWSLRSTLHETKDFCRFVHAGEKRLTAVCGSSVSQWDAKTLKFLETTPLPIEDIRVATLSPDGALLALGNAWGAILIFDLVKKKELTRWKAYEGPVYGLRFASDGKNLLSSHRRAPEADAWQVGTWKKRFTFDFGRFGVSKIPDFAFVPKTDLVAVAGFGARIIPLFHLETGKRAFDLTIDDMHKGGDFCRLAITRDGRWCAAATFGGQFSYWDLEPVLAKLKTP
ncbi:MAG: WD40 repeat domain-containing protein [Gemmataceae bacterium]